MVNKKKNIPNSYHCFKNDEEIDAIFKAPILLCAFAPLRDELWKNFEQEIHVPKKPKKNNYPFKYRGISAIYCHYQRLSCKSGDTIFNFSQSDKPLVKKPNLLYNNKWSNIMLTNIDDIRQNLDEIAQIIAQTVPVESIYLFGSYAYGTPNKDSDLDIYVVFKDELPMRELDAITAISRAIRPVKKMPMDILGLKQNRFHDRKLYATLEKKIVREGVKIYG